MSVLERDLQEVATSAVRMLGKVREGLNHASAALFDADLQAAERALDGEVEIDALQRSLEGRILTIIARRQPAAKDLRFLASTFQSLADIERAGDYAAHVARAGAELAGEAAALAAGESRDHLGRIVSVLDEMLGRTMHGLAAGDAAAARAAHALDDGIDEHYELLQRELLTSMTADPASIAVAIKLLAVARYLERCGDHVENVNEHVLFWLTGERL